MAGLNAGYGSELHLLRMLGRHRQYFDQLVLTETTADEVEWLDFASGDMRLDKRGNSRWDEEWHQLNFLAEEEPAKIAWSAAWQAARTSLGCDRTTSILRQAARMALGRGQSKH